MSAVQNYKPLQRINLKAKKRNQNRSPPTREIAANAALKEARSSYKLMKITNQMDDDIQLVESSEFIDPISVADEVQSNEVLSNEDLQTVAPSVVNKN